MNVIFKAAAAQHQYYYVPTPTISTLVYSSWRSRSILEMFIIGAEIAGDSQFDELYRNHPYKEIHFNPIYILISVLIYTVSVSD